MKKLLLILVCASGIQAQSGITPETLKPAASALLISKQTELQTKQPDAEQKPEENKGWTNGEVGAVVAGSVAGTLWVVGKIIEWVAGGPRGCC